MPELIEIYHYGILDKDHTSNIEFEAIFNDYSFRGTVDVEIEICERAEPEVGIMRDSYQCNGIEYWRYDIINDACEVISLNKDEKNSCRNEIENYFDNLVQNF